MARSSRTNLRHGDLVVNSHEDIQLELGPAQVGLYSWRANGWSATLRVGGAVTACARRPLHPIAQAALARVRSLDSLGPGMHTEHA